MSKRRRKQKKKRIRMDKFVRTLDKLKGKAVLFWPKELIRREAAVSILPLLLNTQDKFISVLTLSDTGPESWRNIVGNSGMKGNLFLKHLMVLSDLGGEALNKLTPLKQFFSPGNTMKYVWRGKKYEYRLQYTSSKGASLTNTGLHVDGKGLTKGHPLNVGGRMN